MRKISTALLSLFLAGISHADNAVAASMPALPPPPFFWDQPDRVFALVLGVVAVAITFQQAIFRKQPANLAEVKVSKN